MSKGKELRVAILAAKAAGKIIMSYYGKNFSISKKSARLGLVTEADVKAQKKIKQVITKAFPKAEFLAEEDKNHAKVSDKAVWIVDPIDGTKNFSRGLNSFAVSIALVKNRKTVVGVVFDPNTNDLFYAEKGKGAFLNGKKIKVSSVSKPEDGIFNIALPRRDGTRKQNYNLFRKMFERMGSLRNFGTAALQMSFIAAGRMDAYLEYGLYPWDVAAALLIVREAGGKATDEKGNQFDMFAGTSIVVSNGKMHNIILKELNK